jgi:hypothetical protein
VLAKQLPDAKRAFAAPRDLPDIYSLFETTIAGANNRYHCSHSQSGVHKKCYVVVLALVQLRESNRELASMNFCPLDINRRVASARAPISSLNHS